MKAVFKLVGLAVALVLILLLAVGLLLPHTWRVERSLLISTSPASIHALVADLHTWPSWADVPKMEAMTFQYSGPQRGEGATRSWQGSQGQHGSITLVRVEPDKGVWFETRVGGDAVTGFGSIRYEEGAAGTLVSWREQGDLPRLFAVYIRDGVEEEIGGGFERGLQRLKKLAEETERAR